ncbi:MAG: YbfB/YjiJ family MFS transporter [Alphaproteobacteria bacterium]|nr:YbfB/YjiJ family MFS transporter [Alphaproteobacteria bacterium]
MGVGRFVYTPILPAMLESTGLGTAEGGLIASANFLGYLAGALIAALPGLPGGPRAWLLGGLAGSALTTAAMALPDGLPAFLALRFMGGVASAFVLVCASTLVLGRLAEAGRPGLSALHFGGVGVGIALSAVLVALAREAGADWRALWLVSGAAAALAVPAVQRAVPTALPQDQAPPPSLPSETAATRGGYVSLVIAYGLFGFGYIITATFLVAIVREAPATAALEPVIWAAVGLAGIPSVAFWSLIGRRLGLRPAYALACLVEAAGILASVLWTGPAGALTAAVLMGGTFMGITALGLMAARQARPANPQRVLALMTAAFGLGQIIGPSFAGLLHDALGSFLVPSLAAAGALILAAALAGRDTAGGSPHRARSGR